MAKFDPFLSLDCARVEGVGAKSKERKGSNFAIWQPCSSHNDPVDGDDHSGNDNIGHRYEHICRRRIDGDFKIR